MDFPTIKEKTVNFVQYLTEFNKPPYTDVDAWREMTILQRMQNYNWSREVFIGVLILSYMFYYVLAKAYNNKMVLRFMDSVKPVLNAQFAQVGVSDSVLTTSDTPFRYTTYATGRQNIESLVMRFRLKDRQNFLAQVFGIFAPHMASPDGLGDHVDIVLTPHDPRKIEKQVFAILSKDSMSELHEEHYYLKHTSLFEKRELPQLTAVFAEHNEQVTELLTDSLKDTISLPGADRVLRILSVSDVGVVEPATAEDLEPKISIRLSLNYPQNEQESFACAKLVESAIEFVDRLCGKQPYRQNCTKKIDSNRKNDQQIIQKIVDEQKREELEKKKAEERRAEAKRELNLSEKEQRRKAKREQDKKNRKQSKKMTRV